MKKIISFILLSLIIGLSAHSQSLDFTDVWEVSKMEAPKHGVRDADKSKFKIRTGASRFFPEMTYLIFTENPERTHPQLIVGDKPKHVSTADVMWEIYQFDKKKPKFGFNENEIPKYVVTSKSVYKNSNFDIIEVTGIDKQGVLKLKNKAKFTVRQLQFEDTQLKNKYSKIFDYEIYEVKKLKQELALIYKDVPKYLIAYEWWRPENLPFYRSFRAMLRGEDASEYVPEVKSKIEPAKPKETISEVSIKKQMSEIYAVSSLNGYKSIRYDHIPKYVVTNKPNFMSGDVDFEVYDVSSLNGYKSIRYDHIPEYAVTSKPNYMMSGEVDYEIYDVSSLKGYKSIRYDHIPKYVIISKPNYMSGEVDFEVYDVSSLKGYKNIRYDQIPKYVITSKPNYVSGEIDFEIYDVSSLKGYKSIKYNDIPIFVISSKGNYMMK